MLKYRYMSQDEQDDVIARELISREREHHNYDLNRQTYEHILEGLEADNLPADWPAHLGKYRALSAEKLAAALSPEDFRLAMALRYRDHVRVLLATNNAEMAKVEGTYLALEAQLPEGERREAAIGRAQAKMALQDLRWQEQLKAVLAAVVPQLQTRRGALADGK